MVIKISFIQFYGRLGDPNSSQSPQSRNISHYMLLFIFVQSTLFYHARIAKFCVHVIHHDGGPPWYKKIRVLHWNPLYFSQFYEDCLQTFTCKVHVPSTHTDDGADTRTAVLTFRNLASHILDGRKITL